jgi:hypothetical protein
VTRARSAATFLNADVVTQEIHWAKAGFNEKPQAWRHANVNRTIEGYEFLETRFRAEDVNTTSTAVTQAQLLVLLLAKNAPCYHITHTLGVLQAHNQAPKRTQDH